MSARRRTATNADLQDINGSLRTTRIRICMYERRWGSIALPADVNRRRRNLSGVSAFCSPSDGSGARLAVGARAQLARSERGGTVTYGSQGPELTRVGGGHAEFGRQVDQAEGRHGGGKRCSVAKGVGSFLDK